VSVRPINCSSGEPRFRQAGYANLLSSTICSADGSLDLSSLFPPSDLLEKARGVESGLRQRKRLGNVGWFGFILISAIQLSLEISRVGLISGFLQKGIQGVSPYWPLLLLTILAVFFLLLGTWSTFWLRESRQPFRYTCSLASFAPISGKKKSPPKAADELLTWLPHDITRLLNERVQRFLFAGEGANAGGRDAKVDGSKSKVRISKSKEGSSSGTEGDSNIHIHGHYVVRARPVRSGEPEIQEIEVMPRVRIGPPSHPEVMAQSVVFQVPLTEGMNRSTYEDLLEQVYHAIITELYRRLKDDVQRKIDLLPTNRFRVIALLYEADDYARSNTLHAYEEAQELYRQAATLADPNWRQRPKTRIHVE
jgi:hypothetical protein